MTNRTVRFVVCSALGLALATLGSGSAFAQDNAAAAPEGAPPAAPAGGEAAPAVAATPAPAAAAPGSPTNITLHAGGVGVEADVVSNMSKSAVGKPFSIVPNIYYGINDQLSVGIANNFGSEVFQTTPGAGLCLAGQSNGCAKVYNAVSLDALFSFMRQATMDIGAHGGLDVWEFSPDLLMKLRVGVKGRVMAGPLLITFDPAVRFGLTKRDADGNKEDVGIPVRLGFLPMPALNVGASVGIFGPLSHFGDLYTIPVGVGGTYSINQTLDARAQFAFLNLAGKGSSADVRALSVGVAYHM